MSSSEKSALGANVISLPKGGGAVAGMGESFSPDLFTGTGNFSVPIAVPPGRNGLQPSLTLGYSTGSGNGPVQWAGNAALDGPFRSEWRGVNAQVRDQNNSSTSMNWKSRLKKLW